MRFRAQPRARSALLSRFAQNRSSGNLLKQVDQSGVQSWQKGVESFSVYSWLPAFWGLPLLHF